MTAHAINPPATPRSLHKSARLGFAAATLVVFAACGSTGRTALKSQSAATAATASSVTAPAASLETTTTQATQPPATIAATVPATTMPTAPPPTAPPATAAPATVAPAPTAPPATEPPTTPPVVTAAPPVSTDPIVAVDANGDAVIVGPDGALTVLYDGIDHDEPWPDEGAFALVTGVAVTSDLSTRFVGTCCEPSPGWVVISSAADPNNVTGRFGDSPALSPDQARLSTISTHGVEVSALDLSASRYVEFVPDDTYMLDVEWIDDSHIVALVSRLTDTALYRYEVTDAALVGARVLSVPGATQLAGVHDGVVYVLGDSATLTAVTGDTLAPVPHLDIALPVVPLSAAMHDGELRWIDQERILHIGDTIVPGQYVWIG